MAASRKVSTCLAGIPIEVLLEIYLHLDVQAIFELSITSRDFYSFFQRRKVEILLPVLLRDFNPFDELLQVHTASVEDVSNGGQYKPRKIVLKRFAGDEGLVFSQGSCVPDSAKTPGPASSAIVLTKDDLTRLLKKCRLVREWEGLFPQMRWFHQPEDCRLLRSHELVRFRRALYRWWMYGIHFHGDAPRPRIGHPEPYVNDIRTSQMRYHSTVELLELMDLLETVKDIILHYICPRLDPNAQEVRSRRLRT